MKFLFNIFNAFTFKINKITNTFNFSIKYVIFHAIQYLRIVTFVFKNIFTHQYHHFQLN